ncbi:hypothetical protein D039_1135B, partial [Vibrio parahaemolyticus EKP-028]
VRIAVYRCGIQTYFAQNITCFLHAFFLV